MDIKEIKSLAQSECYDEALSECQKLLVDSSDDYVVILRLRAYIYTLKGDYNNALQVRKSILNTDLCVLRDYYLAANNALSIGNYQQATVWFNKVLQLGKKKNEKWFESAAFFSLAYAKMELGHYNEALDYLKYVELIEPDCEMALPIGGMCTISQLRKEIANRGK